MADFLFGVPRDVHLAHLQRERDSGDEWTDAAVRVCVLLDLDRGRLRDFTGYGRQWRWNIAKRGPNKGRRTDETGRNAVRRAWPVIVADVVDWITYGGRFWRSPLVDKVPDDWWELADLRPPDDRATTGERPRDDRENPSSEAESQSDDRATTGERPRDDRHTEHHTSSSGIGGVSGARARPGGEVYQSPGVATYEAVVGVWPAPFHAEAVARRFAAVDPGSPAGAALLTAWAEHVTTWHVSPTRNAANLPSILQSFDEHLARTTDRPADRNADPDGHADGAGLGRRRAAPGHADRRNARERANGLDARDLADSAADSLALLRADPDFGGGAAS